MKSLKSLSLLLFVFFSFNVAFAQGWNGIKGEGPMVKKTLSVDNFTGFALNTSGNVFLKQGNRQSVTVEGQENIINNISTKVSNGYWKIKFDKSVRNHKGLNIYITVPSIDKVHVNGSGDVISKDKFSGLNDLSIAISGSGNIDMDFDAKDVSTKISGSGDIDLDGNAKNLSIKIAGSGSIDAQDLQSSSCAVSISGSGDARVDAKSELTVAISGSGDVFYKGNPKLNSRISGSGDINSIN